MKKTPFIVVLIVEILVDLIAMAMLMSDLQAFSYLVGAAILAVVMTPFFLILKKTTDEAKKAKIRLFLFLTLLIPAVIALLAVVAVFVSLLLYFG